MHSVSIECCVFAGIDRTLHVLLVPAKEQRGSASKASYSLPGAPLGRAENPDTAARRVIKDQTALGTDVSLEEQLQTFGDPKRSPGEHLISIVYLFLSRKGGKAVKRRTGSQVQGEEAEWFPVARLPKLARDHRKVVQTAVERLQEKARTTAVIFSLLPVKFTLTSLQLLYEDVLERTFDKRNFRKKMITSGLVEPLDEWQEGVRHRAARLYRFSPDAFRALQEEGPGYSI